MTAGGFFNTLSINNLRQSWKHLEFELPDDGSEFYHTGHGEIALRTKVTLTTLTESGTTKDVTGTIFIKYVRTQYIAK